MDENEFAKWSDRAFRADNEIATLKSIAERTGKDVSAQVELWKERSDLAHERLRELRAGRNGLG